MGRSRIDRFNNLFWKHSFEVKNRVFQYEFEENDARLRSTWMTSLPEPVSTSLRLKASAVVSEFKSTLKRAEN